MMNEDLREWQRVRQGERAALEALCREWLPVVLGWCRRLGGPVVDPDQATHEIFIIVLRKVCTVPQPRAFPSWLYAVTRRVLASHRRQAWGRRWAGEIAPDHADSGPHPEEAASRAELVAQVTAVLEELPDDLREILVLCDIEQRTDAEAAGLLGWPEGTAKSRLRRARMRFAVLAAARGLGPSPGAEEVG